MANVLTDLAADLYKAADVVGRELTGFTAASTINAGSEAAAVGQTVRSFFTRAATVNTIAPAMTIPEGDDQTVDNKTLSLTKQRGVQIPWTGEDVGFVNAGNGFETIYGDQVLQAMRAIANEVEADLATEAYTNASRAVGTAGTTPFASNFNTVAQVRQVLVDNGMPASDGMASLVINTTAGTNLRNLANLQGVNTAGNDMLLRQGELLDLQGLSVKESAQVQSHTKGTATLFDAAGGEPVDETVIAVDGSDSGTILAGDVVTWAGDTNKYVVASATASGAASGNITIGAPGLQAALADTVEGTIGDSFTANVAMHRAALELAIRAPLNPPGGDAARDMMLVQDPRTGISFLVSFYAGYHKAMIEVAAVWGYKAWKPDFIALLLG